MIAARNRVLCFDFWFIQLFWWYFFLFYDDI